MIPGEVLTAPGEIQLNAGRPVLTLEVANTGDRPVQVGSHYHFYETNVALSFDREPTRGHRLDIPAGTAVRFEPGQTRRVSLVPYAGERRVFGFNGKVMGPLDAPPEAPPDASSEARAEAPIDAAAGGGDPADNADGGEAS